MQEAELDQERLVDILDRIGLLVSRRRQSIKANWTPAEFLDYRAEQPPISGIKAQWIDLEHVQCVLGYRTGRYAVIRAHLRIIAHAF